jgi:hypothetical protein
LQTLLSRNRFKPSQTKEIFMSNTSILHPAPVATLIGGAIAYTVGAPDIHGLWGIAAAVATGVVTGYGAQWGRTLLALGGLVGGGAASAAAGAAAGGLLTKSPMERLAGALAGGGVAGVTGGVLLAVVGAIVGYIGGGTLAYKLAKDDINNWVRRQQAPTQNVEVVPHKPSAANTPALQAAKAAFVLPEVK